MRRPLPHIVATGDHRASEHEATTGAGMTETRRVIFTLKATTVSSW
jgi:hypothetical protein